MGHSITNVDVDQISAIVVVHALIFIGNANFETTRIDHIKTVSKFALFDDPIALLHVNRLHDSKYHFSLILRNILEDDRSLDRLRNARLLFIRLQRYQIVNIKLRICWVFHDVARGLFHLFGLLLRHLRSNRFAALRHGPFNFWVHIDLVNGHGIIQRIDEDANHGDVVRSQFILKPEFIRFCHNSFAGFQRVVEFRAHVNDRLIGQKFKHSITCNDNDFILCYQIT
mmetsp:Transcript_14227/g.21890  ORF Transcript_14227/g.21890 Transcript_14227/m.21890 type:complete len:227 (+) Transcript_14227:1730-2410(+)